MADLKNPETFKNTKFEILTNKGFKDFKGLIKGANNDKLKITLDSGETLICTTLHKVMINDSVSARAQSLGIGTKIYGNKKIVNIEKNINDNPVYEFLEIEDTHTYFVNGLLSHQCIIIDEMAHVPDHIMQDFWASVIPVISASKKRTTKIFAVSTPKGASNKFANIYLKAVAGEDTDDGVHWHAESINWNEVPGRGTKWYQEMLAALNGDTDLFAQEFENVFLETGESAIDKEMLVQMSEECREPVQLLDSDHYKIWKAPQNKHIYGIGVDVGEGIGKAASVAQILDFTDLTNIEVVACYHHRLIHPLQFAEILNRIGHHYGCAPMLIERNNCGAQVIDELYKTHGYQNVVTYDHSDIGVYNQSRMGIISHTNTKYAGVMNMRYWINTTKAVTIYDLLTIREMETFIRYPNGTWKKRLGDNIFDDRVLALIWALFLLEDSIVTSYYEVSEVDDYGKPLKINQYVIEQPSLYKLDSIYQTQSNAPLPTFLDINPTADQGMEDLIKQGYRPLIHK